MSNFDHRAHADTLIQSLGWILGVSDLALDPEGRCAVGSDEDTTIDVFYSAANELGTLTLASIVGLLPEQGREAFLAEALRANLYWQGTEGATLSLGPTDQVLLHRDLPIEPGLHLATLRQAIDSLIEVRRAWRMFLEKDQPPLPDMT